MLTKDPVLQKVEQAVQQKVAPQDQDAFQKVVNLGLNIMHSPQTHQFMVNAMQKQGDPAEIVGEGVAKLMAIILHKSKGTMGNHMQATMLGAQVLICEALDFMAQAGKVQPSNELVAAASKAFATYFLQALKVTPEKMQQMLQNASTQFNAKQEAKPKGIINAAGA